MSGLSIFDRPRPDAGRTAQISFWTAPPLVSSDAGGKRRTRIWDIAPTFHCSIVGTCLTAAELRQVFVRMGDADARTATDHALHGRGVRAAGQHGPAGKMLNKALDKRHETVIKRFAKASTSAEIRALWLQALDQGEIPGAYWAVLTHPATEPALVQEVFGEVHMLSHMIGAANRIDIARLRKLEREISERDDKIDRQEQRLQDAARVRDDLARRIETLEGELGRMQAQQRSRAEPADTAAVTQLHQRLDAERAHAGALAARLRTAEGAARTARKQAAELAARGSALQAEVAALEALLRLAETGDGAPAVADLSGRTLLYVGGRPKLIDQLKSLIARHGGALLAHDGGVEDSGALLPGLVSQAHAAFFPVDCISHIAAGQVKKLCRDAGKPFVRLRTASLASFIAAVGAGGMPAPQADISAH